MTPYIRGRKFKKKKLKIWYKSIDPTVFFARMVQEKVPEGETVGNHIRRKNKK